MKGNTKQGTNLKGRRRQSPWTCSKPIGKTTLELPLLVQGRKDKKEVASGKGLEEEAKKVKGKASFLSTLLGAFTQSEWGHWGM